MRTAPLAAACLLAAVLVDRPAEAAPARFTIDPEHTSVAFLVSHIGYHNLLGQFLEVEGSYVFDEETRTLTDLEVTVDTGSVFSNHAKRDEHVRGPDFLASGAHPAITFVGTRAEPTGPDTGKVTGDLTIRGVTRPVTLDVRLNKTGLYPFIDNYVVGVSARTTIRRSDWGMTYGVENGLVGDEVQIIIESEAIRAKQG
jgi:polyisoprenoid-binding protein YceI